MASVNTTANRAIEILLLFDDDHPVLSASTIAAHFGMSKSTTYRYLSSLRSQGLLIERQEGFGLGYRIFELAKAARHNYQILDIASEALEKLSQDLGETVLLTQRFDSNVVILNSWESSHPLRISYHRSRGIPFPAGASGKVFLAFGPHKETEKYFAELARTSTSQTIKDLRDQTELTKARGYAINRGEIDEGISAIAMPILEHSGILNYAVSIVAPMTRLDTENAQEQIQALQSTTHQISEDWARINV